MDKVIKKINLLIVQVQIFGLNKNFRNRVKEKFRIIYRVIVLQKKNYNQDNKKKFI